jgi:hypothetical protein
MRMKEAGAAKTAATRALLGVASMAFAATAFAAEPANNGAMQFKNVQVVQAEATVVAEAAKLPVTRTALKTYVDADTGLPRAPTEAELSAELAAAPAGRPQPAQVSVVASRPNMKMAAVSEEAASYLVVSRDAKGNLVEACVQGESKAQHALHTHAAEVSNDR